MTRHSVRAHIRQSRGPSFDDKLHRQLRKETKFKPRVRRKAVCRALQGGV